MGGLSCCSIMIFGSPIQRGTWEVRYLLVEIISTRVHEHEIHLLIYVHYSSHDNYRHATVLQQHNVSNEEH